MKSSDIGGWASTDKNELPKDPNITGMKFPKGVSLDLNYEIEMDCDKVEKLINARVDIEYGKAIIAQLTNQVPMTEENEEASERYRNRIRYGT